MTDFIDLNDFLEEAMIGTGGGDLESTEFKSQGGIYIFRISQEDGMNGIVGGTAELQENISRDGVGLVWTAIDDALKFDENSASETFYALPQARMRVIISGVTDPEIFVSVLRTV